MKAAGHLCVGEYFPHSKEVVEGFLAMAKEVIPQFLSPLASIALLSSSIFFFMLFVAFLSRRVVTWKSI